MSEDAKRARKLAKELENLCRVAQSFSLWMDAEMKKPADAERGRRIARALNALDMAKDSAWHFALGRALPVKPATVRP